MHAYHKQIVGWLDSASLTHIVQAYEIWPEEPSPGGWLVPQLVTSLLLSTPHVGLAPGVAGLKFVSKGPIGVISEHLRDSDIIVVPPIGETERQTALKKTKRRIRENLPRIRDQYATFCQFANSDIERWMSWSIKSAWEEHAQNFGGLVDHTLLKEMAGVLDVAEKELGALHTYTSRSDVVSAFVKKQPNSDEFRLAKECFLLGYLIRGLFHDYLAKEKANQVLHHPFRNVLLPRVQAKPMTFEQHTVEAYLTNIVLHSALRVRTLEARLKRWADNICLIRKLLRPDNKRIDILKDDPSSAFAEALRGAKVAGVKVHSPTLEEFINVFGAAAITYATSFVLSPYTAFGVGSLTYAALRKRDLGTRLTEAIYTTKMRLARLAEAPPGRIGTNQMRFTSAQAISRNQ